MEIRREAAIQTAGDGTQQSAGGRAENTKTLKEFSKLIEH